MKMLTGGGGRNGVHVKCVDVFFNLFRKWAGILRQGIQTVGINDNLWQKAIGRHHNGIII